MSESSLPRLTELERELMEQLWRRGEGTVHEIRDVLNADSKKPRAYNTVLTVLQRLDNKGFVSRHRNGRRHVFRPAVSRADYLDTRASIEVDSLIATYGDLALAHFASRVATLTPDRRRQLRSRCRAEDRDKASGRAPR